MKQSIILNILLGVIFCLVACDNRTETKVKSINHDVEFINHSLDSITSAKNISLKDLIKERSALDGQNIQTEGIVYFEFENVAICTDNEPDSKCFWLDLNRDLSINDSLLQISSGQRLVIKGTIDNSSKGHLGAYLATIRNVYYLKTK